MSVFVRIILLLLLLLFLQLPCSSRGQINVQLPALFQLSPAVARSIQLPSYMGVPLRAQRCSPFIRLEPISVVEIDGRDVVNVPKTWV
jgi:hypothetical protein